jgi:hypothetical protein
MQDIEWCPKLTDRVSREIDLPDSKRRKRNLLRAVNSQPLLTSSRERHAMGGAAASRHGSKLAAHPPHQPLFHLSKFDRFPS